MLYKDKSSFSWNAKKSKIRTLNGETQNDHCMSIKRTPFRNLATVHRFNHFNSPHKDQFTALSIWQTPLTLTPTDTYHQYLPGFLRRIVRTMGHTYLDGHFEAGWNTFHPFSPPLQKISSCYPDFLPSDFHRVPIAAVLSD